MNRLQCDRQRCRSLGIVVNLDQRAVVEQTSSSQTVRVAAGVACVLYASGLFALSPTVVAELAFI